MISGDLFLDLQTPLTFLFLKSHTQVRRELKLMPLALFWQRPPASTAGLPKKI